MPIADNLNKQAIMAIGLQVICLVAGRIWSPHDQEYHV
ncbi:MAG: hypothetical protein HLUCCA13_05775 [Halomonas sp. HL-48]|nr:MAG: hypothetical protein HLUCCA13_05775 [Halomonas sp. HL-48]